MNSFDEFSDEADGDNDVLACREDQLSVTTLVGVWMRRSHTVMHSMISVT